MGELNVAEVAYQIGYNSPSHFTKVFQEHFGYPPGKKRANHILSWPKREQDWQFSQTFVRLIVFAFGGPTRWRVISSWLPNFQYRISLGPSIFLLALLTTAIVALLTVNEWSTYSGCAG